MRPSARFTRFSRPESTLRAVASCIQAPEGRGRLTGNRPGGPFSPDRTLIPASVPSRRCGSARAGGALVEDGPAGPVGWLGLCD